MIRSLSLVGVRWCAMRLMLLLLAAGSDPSLYIYPPVVLTVMLRQQDPDEVSP